MKKKIKDLTIEEIIVICKKARTNKKGKKVERINSKHFVLDRKFEVKENVD